jgi:hypothetical protein
MFIMFSEERNNILSIPELSGPPRSPTIGYIENDK